MSVYTDPVAERVWLVEIEAYDPAAGSPVMLYAGTADFVTGPADTPANTYYIGRVIRPMQFRRDLWENGKIGGRSAAGRGSITLDNSPDYNSPDGVGPLEDWLGYVYERPVTVRLGLAGADYSAFETVFRGRVSGIDYDRDTIAMEIADNLDLLDKPLSEATFGGAGGADGDAAQKGVPRPYGFGLCRNVPAVLVNSGPRIYQVHHGAIQAVDAVRVKGASLTAGSNYATYAALAAATVSIGTYGTCLAEGLVRIGSAVDGQVTVDFLGDATGGVYVSTVADIAERMAVDYGGLEPGDLDATAFAALNTSNSAVVGYWTDRAENILNILDALMDSIGAWYTTDRAGRLTCGRLEAPTATDATADLVIGGCDVLAGTMRRRSTGIPPWRVTVGYRRVWAVQDGDSLVGALTPEQRAYYGRAYRQAIAEDAAIQTAHPLSQPVEYDTLLDAEAAAAAEAARLVALYDGRDVFELTTTVEGLTLVPGVSQVWLSHPRYGLAAGRAFRLIGIDEDGASQRATLTLWG